jgi:Golgi phosphoprotein 3 (GPP34)
MGWSPDQRPALGDQAILLAIESRPDKKLAGGPLRGLLGYELGPATLLDLVLEGRLLAVAWWRGRRQVGEAVLEVSDASPTGDDVFDGALGDMVYERPRSAEWWVERARKRRGLGGAAERYFARLAERGLLSSDDSSSVGARITGLLSHSLPPRLAAQRWRLADRQAGVDVRERVRLALKNGVAPDARTALLIRNFTGRAGLFPGFPSGSFSREERRCIDSFQGGRGREPAHWRALQEVVNDRAIDPKVSGTVRAIETAMHRTKGGEGGGGGF